FDRLFEFPDGIEVPPVHPGKTLAAELEVRGLSANALDLKQRVPANRITDIVRGQRAISPETALRLGSLFWDECTVLDEPAVELRPRGCSAGTRRRYRTRRRGRVKYARPASPRPGNSNRGLKPMPT